MLKTYLTSICRSWGSM